MKAFFRHIFLLQWKNAKLKQRNKVRTLFEVIAPLFSFLILIAVRQSQDFYQQSPDCQFKPTALASKGPLVALRSFCFLGVCRQGNESFGVDSSLLNDTEYRNLSDALGFVNGALDNPTVRKIAGALDSLPKNWSDPSQAKPILLGSMFKDNSSKLFNGVNSTEEQRSAVYAASFPFPARWDLSINSLVEIALGLALQKFEVVPILVCSSGASGGASSWSAVKALCNQTAFKTNLKEQFVLDQALSQMTSTAPDKFTISVETSDINNLKNLFKEFHDKRSNGTFNVFTDIYNKLKALFGGAAACDDAIDGPAFPDTDVVVDWPVAPEPACADGGDLLAGLGDLLFDQSALDALLLCDSPDAPSSESGVFSDAPLMPGLTSAASPDSDELSALLDI